MRRRALGNTGLAVSFLGLGAVKIGRNRKLRYPTAFDLPDDAAVAQLLHGTLDLGINLIDTAPAYGRSEELIGKHLADRREELVLTTKAGEDFDNDTGRSRFDFSTEGIVRSVERSLRRLRTDAVDVVLLHSDGDDMQAMLGGAVEALVMLKKQGKTRRIGFSGKTVGGARAALGWAEVVMVAFHAEDVSHAEVMAEAKEKGVGVLVKKGLAAGHLGPTEALGFLVEQSAGGVGELDAAVVGTLSLDHLAENVSAVESAFLGRGSS